MYHGAVVYRDETEYVRAVGDFVTRELNDGDHVVIAVPGARSDVLRAALEPGLARKPVELRCVDMSVLGRNPGRMTSAWHRWALDAQEQGVCLHGVGEPVWPGRTLDELFECTTHERLLDHALDGLPASILCPYAAGVLGAEQAGVSLAVHRDVPGFRAPSDASEVADEWSSHDGFVVPLDEPREVRGRSPVHLGELAALRGRVAGDAASLGMPAPRQEDVALAVSEMASNAVLHGSGDARLRWWASPGANGSSSSSSSSSSSFVVEARNHGRLHDPLVGRRYPRREQPGGRGIWLLHQLCDLVQLRSFANTAVARATFLLGS